MILDGIFRFQFLSGTPSLFLIYCKTSFIFEKIGKRRNSAARFLETKICWLTLINNDNSIFMRNETLHGSLFIKKGVLTFKVFSWNSSIFFVKKLKKKNANLFCHCLVSTFFFWYWTSVATRSTLFIPPKVIVASLPLWKSSAWASCINHRWHFDVKPFLQTEKKNIFCNCARKTQTKKKTELKL